MSLINCPECNHQVSDKAISCPNCGYPINSIGQEQSNSGDINKCNEKYRIIFKKLGAENKLEVIKNIRILLNIGFKEVLDIVDNPPSVIIQNISLETAKSMQTELNKFYVITEIEKCASNQESFSQKEEEIKRILNKHQDDKVRCPHCGSSSITTGQRGFSIITGFWGSNKTVNRCGACGYSWRPKK